MKYEKVFENALDKVLTDETLDRTTTQSNNENLTIEELENMQDNLLDRFLLIVNNEELKQQIDKRVYGNCKVVVDESADDVIVINVDKAPEWVRNIVNNMDRW